MATIYVKSTATGAANGTSWTDAYTTIQAAVTAASTNDTIQIWAATYTENLVFGATQNGKNITLVGGNGGTVRLTASSGIVFSIATDYLSGTITCQAMTIDGSGTVTDQVKLAGTAQLVFTNCILGGASDAGRVILVDITAGCTSQYPTQDTDHVKATSDDGANYRPWLATDPTKSLTGTYVGNQWIDGEPATTNQRFHIDLGSAKLIKRIYYENGHGSGVSTDGGARSFTFWGSNDAGAFAELTYGTDTNWTQLTCSQDCFDQHVALDQADPKYILVANAVAYRYYAVKIADNWGHASWISLRRIVLQESAPSSVTCTNCTIIHSNTSTCIALDSNASLSVAGGSATAGTRTFLSIGGHCGAVSFAGVAMDMTAIGAGYLITSVNAGCIVGATTFADCTITTTEAGGLFFDSGPASLTVTDCTITDSSTTTTRPLLVAGVDGTMALRAKIGYVSLLRNRLEYAGTALSHGLLVGRGITGGRVAWNTIINADYGIVVKCDGVTIERNVAIGPASGGLGAVFVRGGSTCKIRNNAFYVTAGSAIQFDTQDGAAYENADTASTPGNVQSLSIWANVAAYSSLIMLPPSVQPPAKFRVRVALWNASGGALNLYEGVTTYVVTGTLDGVPVSENITFTSTAGNKSVAAGKYRTAASSGLFDAVTAIAVGNLPAATLLVAVGIAGVRPTLHEVYNNIVYLASGNTSDFLAENVAAGDGNLRKCFVDYNCYSRLTASGNFASLNYGVSPPTVAANLAALQAGWAIYSPTYPANDAHSITGDPLATDPADGDFTLAVASPCRGAGGGADLSIPDGAGGDTVYPTDIGRYSYPPGSGFVSYPY